MTARDDFSEYVREFLRVLRRAWLMVARWFEDNPVPE